MSEQKEAPQQPREPEPEQSGESLDSPTADRTDGDSGVMDTRPTRRGGNAPAWLALLLALIAVGLTGWQWWLARTEDDDSGALLSGLDEQAATIESQASNVAGLGDRVDAFASRLDRLAGQVESSDFDPAELRRQLESHDDARTDLQQRVVSLSERVDQAVSNLESRLEQAGAARSDQIEQTLTQARYRLGLLEVASLLRLGQSRAELASDPAGAIAAYQRAQSRLENFEGDRAARLRQLVARELEALRSVETTDWAALAGRLSALETELAQWPLSPTEGSGAGDDPAEEPSAQGDGWWSSLRGSLDGLVRVTPRASAPLAPAAVESVRERVRLHLAAAQSAVARRSVAELAVQLEIAGELIRRHFDTSAEAVSRALEAISAASSADTPSLPDLGEALAETERRLAAS